MTTCCSTQPEFQPLFGRQIAVNFDAAHVTSDAGALLLREIEQGLKFIERLATCFSDSRDAERITHTLPQLLAQRIYAIILGYPDLNDHDRLRFDPLFSMLAGKDDPHVNMVAGKSTLNRLELSPDLPCPDSERYHKISWSQDKIDRFFLDLFLDQFKTPPEQIVLDLDATDVPLHGHQEAYFFHGYYDCYCYLPLYIFSGDHLLCARLRPSDIDGCAGWDLELPRIVEGIRERFGSKVRIIVRADSGFCRDSLLTWCEDNHVDYVIGLAKNEVLKRWLAPKLAEAEAEFKKTREASRVFDEFGYRTRETWSRFRRVIGKAEHLEKGSNPRFIVTSLSVSDVDGQELYEQRYCARGEAENRIKEQQLDLFGDRLSTHFMKSNQLRLYFASLAYALVNELRRLGLSGTEMAEATVGTIRTHLLKVGAQIRVSVRRVSVSFSKAWPGREMFERCLARLRQNLFAVG